VLADRVFVFVDGTFGDAIGTLRNSSNQYLWDFVADSPIISSFNLYIYGFPSRCLSSSFAVNKAADYLYQQMELAGVHKHKQVIFVAHSMGGLVVETMLLRYEKLAERTPLILGGRFTAAKADR